MSMGSLIDGVVARLQSPLTGITTLTAPALQIDKQDNGQPPKNLKACQVYVAVHYDRTTGEGAAVRAEVYRFFVTISINKSTTPADRSGRMVNVLTNSLEPLAEVVKTSLTGMPGGYALLSGLATSGWVEPPVCVDDGTAEGKWPGWLSQTMTFDGARRVRAASGM